MNKYYQVIIAWSVLVTTPHNQPKNLSNSNILIYTFTHLQII